MTQTDLIGTELADPTLIEFKLKALRVRQPIGDMYILSMEHDLITRISDFDVRRLISQEREVESYLGIQRPLSIRRAEEISQDVNFQDATFPSAIILAIQNDYAEYDEDLGEISIRNFRQGEHEPSRMIRDVARVLDGQHRIEGLKGFRGDVFEVVVTLFVGADIADQPTSLRRSILSKERSTRVWHTTCSSLQGLEVRSARRTTSPWRLIAIRRARSLSALRDLERQILTVILRQ